jgi:hypothetical protein
MNMTRFAHRVFGVALLVYVLQMQPKSVLTQKSSQKEFHHEQN